MKALTNLLASGQQNPKRIVLSEGADTRVLTGAMRALTEGLAQITLIGHAPTIRQQMQQHGYAEDCPGLEIHDPLTSPMRASLAEAYFHLRKHKGLSLDDAVLAVQQPHVYAALLVKQGYADGTIGGAITATPEIVRAAIQIIGLAENSVMVSSFFLMLLCAPHHSKQGAFVFADCGLVIEPSAEELVEIARASAKSYAQLVADTPRVGLLSFSTRGSAQHERVAKVAKATELLQAADSELIVDGELQFDAAFVPEVARTKAPDSPLSGAANVFIFPNLESGNIAYKIAQRIGGAIAIGPVLQGLAHPANDLSRGCSAEDVLYMIAITVAQANK